MPGNRKPISLVSLKKTSPKKRTSQKKQVSPDRQEYLQDIINRCDLVINGLESSGAWTIVLEDVEETRQRLDDTWQNISNEKQWYEFRVTKMAVMKIINLIDDYKNDLKTASEELFKAQNPDKAIQADVQND